MQKKPAQPDQPAPKAINAIDLLADLRAEGVVLTTYAERLEYDAPPGVMTAARREALRQQKAAVIELLLTEQFAAYGLARCSECRRIMPGHYLSEGVCDDCRRPTPPPPAVWECARCGAALPTPLVPDPDNDDGWVCRDSEWCGRQEPGRAPEARQDETLLDEERRRPRRRDSDTGMTGDLFGEEEQP